MPFSASKILEKGKGGGTKEQPEHKHDAKQDLWLLCHSLLLEQLKVIKHGGKAVMVQIQGANDAIC